MEQKFLSKKEAAAYLRVHLNTLDRWIKKGWIKTHRVGYRVLIYESDLMEFIDRNGNYNG